jgi:anti-sigma factor RsiW
MTCGVREEDLSALMDGELDALDERRVRDHLAVCVSCRREFARVRALSRSLRTLGAPVAPSPDFVRRVALASAGARRKPARPRLSALPLLLRHPVALAASLLLLLGFSAAFLVSSLPGAAGPGPVTSVGVAPPAMASPDEAVDGIVAGLSQWPEAVVGEGPDYGDPLPARPSRPETAALRGEALYRALGLTREGDGHLSAEAFARRRAHLEEEELLARSEERRVARERTEAGPPRAQNPVAAMLVSLTPGPAREGGGLAVVVLRDGEGSVGVSVVPADRAFAEGILTVTESRASGRIVARNADPARHVFLASGVVLAGGHQDRLLTRPVLIPPRSQVALPVLCCEAGRSSGAEDRFRGSPGIAPPAVRGLLVATGDQGAIWDRIALELDRGGAKSPTGALREAYASGDGARRVAALLPAFSAVMDDPLAVGFLVFAGDRFLGGEVFGDHALLRLLGPGALRSYLLAAPAKDEGAAIGRSEASAILRRAAAGAYYETPGATFGRELEFDEEALCGTALVPLAGGRPLMVSILPRPAALPAPPPGPDGEGQGPRTGTDQGPPPVDPGPEPRREPVEERMRERRGDPQVPWDLPPPERRPDPPGAGGNGSPGGSRPGDDPRSLPPR